MGEHKSRIKQVILKENPIATKWDLHIRLVWAAITTPENWPFYATNTEIADFLGISISSVKRALLYLEGIGHIKRIDHGIGREIVFGRGSEVDFEQEGGSSHRATPAHTEPPPPAHTEPPQLTQSHPSPHRATPQTLPNRVCAEPDSLLIDLRSNKKIRKEEEGVRGRNNKSVQGRQTRFPPAEFWLEVKPELIAWAQEQRPDLRAEQIGEWIQTKTENMRLSAESKGYRYISWKAAFQKWYADDLKKLQNSGKTVKKMPFTSDQWAKWAEQDAADTASRQQGSTLEVAAKAPGSSLARSERVG